MFGHPRSDFKPVDRWIGRLDESSGDIIKTIRAPRGAFIVYGLAPYPKIFLSVCGGTDDCRTSVCTYAWRKLADSNWLNRAKCERYVAGGSENAWPFLRWPTRLDWRLDLTNRIWFGASTVSVVACRRTTLFIRHAFQKDDGSGVSIYYFGFLFSNERRR